jgi:hypothetical protein
MEISRNTTNAPGTLSEINGRFAAISSNQFIVPLQTRGAHLVAIGDAGHKIKRLYTLQKMLDQECEKLATEKEAYEMKVDLRDIIGLILRNEIWRQYPALAHKPFVICSDWTLCWEKKDAETSDLAFKPVGLGELAKAHLMN